MQSSSYLRWNTINPDEFEDLCQTILGSLGFQNIVRLGGSGDRGRDIVCNITTEIGNSLSFSTKWVVQCKHYVRKPQKKMLSEDLAKAQQHDPDFWLLMTSATLSPNMYDWLNDVDRNNQYKFRILILDRNQISRIILQQPDLAFNYRERLFKDQQLEVSKIMGMMGNGKYQEALSALTKLSTKANPRIAYLESCCRSKLAESSLANSIDRIESVAKAFDALTRALASGYISQMNLLIGYPEEKIIYDIERDPELKTLREEDPAQFKIILQNRGIVKKQPKEEGKKLEYHSTGPAVHYGCFVANTPIRLISEVEKPISKVRVGDVVSVPIGSSYGAVVSRVFSVGEDCLVAVNNKIVCSLTQPLLTTRGWKQALELQTGDVLLRANTMEPIINLLYQRKHVELFMITLSSEHSFYAADYIVHNKEP